MSVSNRLNYKAQIVVKTISTIVNKAYVRVIFSLVLLTIAISQVNNDFAINDLFSIKFILSSLVAALFANAVLALTSYRWSRFFQTTDEKIRYISFLESNYIGSFYNLILPTSNGGDFIKWTHLKQLNISKTKLFLSVFADRFIGMTALFLLGSISLGLSIRFNLYQPAKEILFIILFPTIIFLTIIFLLFIKIPIANQLGNNAKKLYVFLGSQRYLLLTSLLISLLSNIIVGIEYLVLGMIWGYGTQLAYIFVLMPLIGLFLLLPISVGGLGAKEVIMIYFFNLLGLSTANVLMITLSNTFGKFLISLIGWLILNKKLFTK